LDEVLSRLARGRLDEMVISFAVPDSDASTICEAVQKETNGLYVTVEAIHAGMTKNKTFYPADKLEASAHTWTTPYPKPVIKNHDVDTEPLGRVVEAVFKQSALKPSTYTIQLKLHITDPDAIQKILDGRYLTLSIGGSTNEARCSICNKNIVEEGWCGHLRGRKYDGKEAYWILGDMEFEEISFVNVPADENARILSIDTPDASPEGRQEAVENQQTPQNSADLIDSELFTENKQEQQDVKHDVKNEPINESSNEPQAPSVEELQEAVRKLEEERDALKAKVEELSQKLAEQQSELALVKEERDSFRDKNIALAKTAHRLLAERAVDLRIHLGEAKKEEREELIKEYAQTPARVLEGIIQDLLAKEPSRRDMAPQVQNPGLAIGETVEKDGMLNDSASGKSQKEDKDNEVDIEKLGQLFGAFFASRGLG